MRPLSFVLAAAFLVCAAPATASAGHKSKPATTFAGAGQRLHFSFGGSLKLKNQNTKVFGNFMIILHPAAPNGETLSVVCSYHQFSNASVQGNTIEFDGQGTCKVLATDGQITKVAAKNHFKFVDNGATGDTVDVDSLLTGGVSIPSGELSFGDFTLTVPQPS